MKQIRVITLLSIYLLLGATYAHCSQPLNLTAQGKGYSLSSPNGKVMVLVDSTEGIRWSILYNGVEVLQPSQIDILLQQGKRSWNIGNIVKSNKQQISATFATPFYKKAVVEDNYGELQLYTNQNFIIEFRAYNDGAAYRIVRNGKGSADVINETVEFSFADDYRAFVPYVNDNRQGERYCYSFESYYDEQHLSEMYADSLAITPLALSLPNGIKAVVLDAGVENYPGMMLKKGAAAHTLIAEFAPYPILQGIGGFNRLNIIPTHRAEFIAKIDGGEFKLPWRAVVITEHDAELLNSDMAQRLAPECRIDDTSWIKPGKVAWDWWNNTNIYGVDFQSGMNTDTYLYYIDFAAKNSLEYIIIDEGWSGKESLLEQLNPEIDLPRLIAYGNDCGVGIILWSSWRNMIGNNPQGDMAVTDRIMKHYADMGIKGFKIDFFDRDDQLSIASAYKIAASAAKYRLCLDYHGLKPFGIQRAYPNVLNFEGVKGLENSKWEPRTGSGPLHDQPRYDVTAPYLRMLAGAMDYTPGAMSNAMRDSFFGNNNHPMSQGTRVHQMAMYTIFEAPLQMLADSPTKYMQNRECTSFIAQIPTTFDETVALDGIVGEYVVLARRKGDVWYIAALSNWTARELRIPLNFLSKGEYQAEVFADGINSAKEATDYKRSQMVVESGDTLTINLGSGGGWTAILLPM